MFAITMNRVLVAGRCSRKKSNISRSWQIGVIFLIFIIISLVLPSTTSSWWKNHRVDERIILGKLFTLFPRLVTKVTIDEIIFSFSFSFLSLFCHFVLNRVDGRMVFLETHYHFVFEVTMTKCCKTTVLLSPLFAVNYKIQNIFFSFA